MFKNILKKKSEGFTIIEVMIVLAIAGLIMVVVLIAIPQLQKNQRNESRRNVLARVSAEVSNYIGNNEGIVPAEGATGTNTFMAGFIPRYITNAPAGTFNTPGGAAYTYGDFGTQTAIPQDTILYNAGGSCNGELPSGTGTSTTRSFAIAVGLEGGASFCVDNQ